MDDVAFPINHNVAVMSILDLQDIAGYRVRRHGLDEVESSLLERYGVDTPILVDEVGDQVVDLGAAHFVPGCGVWDDVNDTALLLR